MRMWEKLVSVGAQKALPAHTHIYILLQSLEHDMNFII